MEKYKLKPYWDPISLNGKVTVIKTRNGSKCWQGCRKGRPSNITAECKLVQPLWSSSKKWNNKTNRKTPSDLFIPLLVLFTNKNSNQQTTEILEHPCLLQHYTITKIWNPSRCLSMNEQKRMCYAVSSLTTVEKNKIMLF